MGEMAKALALEESFQHKGKTYKLAPLVFEVMGFFEQWLEDRAYDALERRRKRFTPDEYEKKEIALLGAIAAGKFSFFSEASAQAMTGGVLSPGFRKIISLRLKAVPGQDITDELIDEILEEQADRLLHLAQRQDAPDPNAAVPAAGAGSASSPSAPDSSSAA